MAIPQKDLDRIDELRKAGAPNIFPTFMPAYPEGCRVRYTVNGRTFDSLEEAEAHIGDH